MVPFNPYFTKASFIMLPVLISLVMMKGASSWKSESVDKRNDF
jgi:hypothetical protein